MDILQTHFFQKKSKNKLFFKVDMSDLIDDHIESEGPILRDNYTYNTENELNLLKSKKIGQQFTSM